MDSNDLSRIVQDCLNAINKRVSELKTLNIIIVGKSGVGKSTLINSIFKDDFAETGLGRPVTSEIRKIEKKNYPLAIYDTPGFELSSSQQNKVKDEIIELIHKGYKGKNVNDVIHCIWYCINVNGNRTFDETEITWLRALTEANSTQVPVMVILTQAVPKSKAAEMKNLVEKENLDIVKIVPVLAKDINFDDEYTAKAYGLDTLIEIMAEILPDELQDTLQHVQIASLKSKKKRAQAIVAGAVAGSFGEGFIPIPVADAAMMIPTQVAMIAGITAVFGLNISNSLLTSFISSTIGTAGATVLGKTVVSGILKLVPGVGTVAGGVISGATAGLITTALGEAYIKIMEMMYKGEISKDALETADVREKMSQFFKDGLKIKK